MTTIVGYLSADSRGPSAVTLISDSRVTFAGGDGYDCSQKLFFLRKSPSIFGYCGDSLFSLAALSQVGTTLDLSDEFIYSDCIRHKMQLVQDVLSSAAEGYPIPLDATKTQIIQITRIAKTFHICEFHFDGNTNRFDHKVDEIPAESESCLLGVWGSGESSFREICGQMTKRNGEFARVYYRSLLLQLAHECDASSGGPPQMVVLGRDELPTPVGIRHQGETYLAGLRYKAGKVLPGIKFRNECYEFVDQNGKRLSKSQRHGYQDWKPSE